jgi:hypothetical protein
MYFKVYLQFRLHTMNVKGDRSFGNIFRSSARAVCDITHKARIQLTKIYPGTAGPPVVTPDALTVQVRISTSVFAGSPGGGREALQAPSACDYFCLYS